MQDEQRPIQNEDKTITGTNNDVPANVEKLLAYLGEVWQRLREPSADDLQQMAQCIMAFPEPYRTQGLQTIAQHLTNYMSLHLLKLMTTFQQKAEAEGIDAEEVAATFTDLLPESFQMIERCTHITIHSIDDLVNLTNISVGLAGLSRVDTAERAQRWMYNLPPTYLDHLVEAGLLPVEYDNEDFLVDKDQEFTESNNTVTKTNFTPLTKAQMDFVQTSIKVDQTSSESAA